MLCVTVCAGSRGTFAATSTTLGSSRCDCSHGTLPVSAAAKTESADAVKLVGLRRRGGEKCARGADARKCCHLHQLRRGLLLAPKQKRHPGAQGPRSGPACSAGSPDAREHVQDGLRRAQAGRVRRGEGTERGQGTKRLARAKG